MLVHGLVGLQHQFCDRCWTVRVKSRNAQAERNRVARLPGAEGFQQFEETSSDRGLTVPGCLNRKNSELVSPQTSDNIRVPKCFFQNVCHALQRAIAFQMAERVVNLFQVVNVHHKEQHSTTGSAPKFQLAFCQGRKTATVIQACELVRKGKITQLCLKRVLLRRTADRAYQ